MSELWSAFKEWAKANLPRGYTPPPVAELLVESGLQNMPQELMEKFRSNKNNLVYLHFFQTSLLELSALAKGDLNALQAILLIRGIQYARALDLKTLNKNIEEVMANPNKYFDTKKLRWGWKLSNVKGRPGGDRMKFLLLLTPYRKLIDEEKDNKFNAERIKMPKMAPDEKAREEKKIRKKCLDQARNSVNRAWRDIKRDLPDIIVFLLVVQFYIWRDYDKNK